jgi:hypothetical protein
MMLGKVRYWGTSNIYSTDGDFFYTVTIVLKELSHEVFTPVFWLVWIYLGLNGNRFSFLNFKEGSLILDRYFKY